MRDHVPKGWKDCYGNLEHETEEFVTANHGAVRKYGGVFMCLTLKGFWISSLFGLVCFVGFYCSYVLPMPIWVNCLVELSTV